MINKKMKNKLFLGITTMAMVGASMVITSCDTENDLEVVNPSQAELDANWLAKFGEIDQNQDWSLATSVPAEISVYGIDAISDYYLQLYTDNPISSSDALLMASKKVTTDENGNASVSFDAVDILKGHTVFYACYMDSHYRKNVKPVALIDGTIDAQFGKPASSTRATANSDSFVMPTAADPTNDVMTKHDKSVEVNRDNCVDHGNGESYDDPVLKISGNWTGNIATLGLVGDRARTLYIESDATWTLNGDQQINKGGLVVVRNGGTIKIPSGSSLKTTEAGRLVVLAGGKIEGDGEIIFCNGSGTSYDYNAGTITIGTMDNNGGRVFNYGTMTINQLEGSNGKDEYVNHGTMTVDHSNYNTNNANTRIYNACQFECTNDFACRNMYLGSPSKTHIGGDLLMGRSGDGTSDLPEIIMAKNSYLKVDKGVALNYVSIVGPTEENQYAICEFGQIGDTENQYGGNYCGTNYEKDASGQITEGCVINNLKISIDNPETITNYYTLTPYAKFVLCMMNGHQIEAYTTTDDGWKTQYVTYKNLDGIEAGNGNAVIVAKGVVDMSIPALNCTNQASEEDTYTGKDGDPTPAQAQTFIIACEDLGSTNDIDFNDVVFSVGHVAGENFITITPLAAGGTLAANIMYDDQPVGEIHNLLGVTNTQSFINTSSQNINVVGTPVTITVPDDWTFSDNYGKFSVVVTTNENKSEFITAPKTGEAPFMIVAPDKWAWPLEKVSIEAAYPNFTDWSQNAAINDAWTTNRVEGKTVTRK